MLDQGTYIQISVNEIQKTFARNLVEYSLLHHKITNIWDHQITMHDKTRILRYTGTLGETVFADAYHLPRPEKSFGAHDGQDWGQDFLIPSDDFQFALDIKSMKRMNGSLQKKYVLNIPSSQLHKVKSVTTHYFCISFHQCPTNGTVASLLGFIEKDALKKGEIGIYYPANTKRIRQDKSHFVFNEDTYEVFFQDLKPPILTESMQLLKGFKICQFR